MNPINFGAGMRGSGAASAQAQPMGLSQFNTQPLQQPDLGALLGQLIASHQPRHLGMGGEQITQANPMGNPGGDPFTNGFFHEHTQPQIDPAAQAATRGQMFNAGVAPTQPNVGQITQGPQSNEMSIGQPSGIAGPNQLSGFESQHGMPGGSLPLGTQLSPFGYMFGHTPAPPVPGAGTMPPPGGLAIPGYSQNNFASPTSMAATPHVGPAKPSINSRSLGLPKPGFFNQQPAVPQY